MLREIDDDRAQFALLKADQMAAVPIAPDPLNHLAMVDLRRQHRNRRRGPSGVALPQHLPHLRTDICEAPVGIVAIQPW